MYTKNKHLLLISSARVCAKSSALTKSTVKALKFYISLLFSISLFEKVFPLYNIGDKMHIFTYDYRTYTYLAIL